MSAATQTGAAAVAAARPWGRDMGKAIYGLSRGTAWLGAAVLAAMALMSVVSIIGRSATAYGLGPVPGDFELVEAGTAIAVFCFLPWAHLNGAHAAVDLFWGSYPVPMRRFLEILADAGMLAVWVLLTWRMGVAMQDYRAGGDTSFILRMPLWWGYAAALVPAVIGCAAYAWRLLESLGVVRHPYGFPRAGGGH